jgi:hypothetical protein
MPLVADRLRKYHRHRLVQLQARTRQRLVHLVEIRRQYVRQRAVEACSSSTARTLAPLDSN